MVVSVIAEPAIVPLSNFVVPVTIKLPTTAFPPIKAFPVIPAPPDTFRAPVPVVVETAPLPIAISPVVVNVMDCDRFGPVIVLFTILFP